MTNGNGHKPSDALRQGSVQAPVSIIAAGPPDRVKAWYEHILGDGRFRSPAFSFTPDDLRAKLSANVEALLLDGCIFPNGETLLSFLAGLRCIVHVVVPADVDDAFLHKTQQVACVKGVYRGDTNFIETLGRICAEALTLRQAAAGGGLSSLWASGAGGGPVPTRIIAVWNQMGGVGKTTIATNLAYEAARRGFATLLVGLGAPDDLPLVCGTGDRAKKPLMPTPNVMVWRNDPTLAGLKRAIQKVDTLDVIAGFANVFDEATTLNTPDNDPHDVANLFTQAAQYGGYAVIVADLAPASHIASRVLSVANTLVLVSRPSVEGALRTVEAYRMVTEKMASAYHIPANRVFVVLNRMGGRLSADRWHEEATGELNVYTEGSFPAVIAQIPDNVAVGAAQDERRLPLLCVDDFSRALAPLADTVLQSPSPMSAAMPASQKKFNGGGSGSRQISIGPLRVRLGG